MSSPSVSICMPVYNTKRYVAEAVESILAQTFGDFEFIIIDDGSTDGSRAILERYAKQDDRIRLISRPNTGIVGARNEALGLARGELIAVMDSDDVALPERFEVQVAYLREHPECVVVGSRALIIDPDGCALTIMAQTQQSCYEPQCSSPGFRRMAGRRNKTPRRGCQSRETGQNPRRFRSARPRSEIGKVRRAGLISS